MRWPQRDGMTCSGEASFTQKLRLFTEFPWSEKTTGLKSHFSPSSPTTPFKSMIFLECCVSRHAHIQQTPQPAGFQCAQPSWGKPGAQPVCWATLPQWVPLAALGMHSETCSLQGQLGLSGEWPAGLSRRMVSIALAVTAVNTELLLLFRDVGLFH